uniref:Uncharacterized protein n=1 Tax=Cacopsylla melanoneura TaxID=428564 RepID=A0A8D8QAS4_9HEMI
MLNNLTSMLNDLSATLNVLAAICSMSSAMLDVLHSTIILLFICDILPVLVPLFEKQITGITYTYLTIPISETNDCPSYNSYLLPLCCGHLNNLSSISCLDLHSHQSIKLCIIMLIPSHTDFNIQFCFLCLFLPTPCPRYPGQSFLILCFSCGNKAADVFCIVSV